MKLLPRKENERLLTPPLTCAPGRFLANPCRCVDKVDCVIVVLFDTGGYGQHIGVEYNIVRIEAYPVDQQTIGTFAYFDLTGGSDRPALVRRKPSPRLRRHTASHCGHVPENSPRPP